MIVNKKTITTIMCLMLVSVIFAPSFLSEDIEIKDDYPHKIVIVSHDSKSYFDDLIYLSAIPTCIKYDNPTSNPDVSALIYDKTSTNEKYFVEDLADSYGKDIDIVCLGDVGDIVINHYRDRAGVSAIATWDISYNSLYYDSTNIATFHWGSCDKAVLVYDILNEDRYVDYIQAASNGAVVASLKNCPLIYTGESLPDEVETCLEEMNVNDVILVVPEDENTDELKQDLSSIGINVEREVKGLTQSVQYIKSLKNTKHITLMYNNEEERTTPWDGKSKEKTFDYAIKERLTIFLQKFIDFLGLDIFDKLIEKIDLKTNKGHIGITKDNEADVSTDISDDSIIGLQDSYGDKDEMPFGPTAYLAAFHASPVVAFPTQNSHCQIADDNAEAVGDMVYAAYKEYKKTDDWVDETPDFDQMCTIGQEFFNWMGEIGADGSGVETVLIVADLAEIDPSLDRAIFGKGIAGRFCSGEGPDAACLINRNILYSDIIKANNGNKAMMSFIAYGHGCKFTDNNNVEQVLYESEQVPEAWEQAGVNVDYHVNFDSMCNELKSGVRYWVNAGHAYYPKSEGPVFGQGSIAAWRPDDVWRAHESKGSPDEPDVDSDGYVFLSMNPILTPSKNTNQYLSKIGNLHSCSMYWLLCNIGGCEGPVLWQRNGASVVVASYTSVSFEGGGWFDVRINQELAQGKNYGEAVLQALSDSSNLYSLGKRCVDERAGIGGHEVQYLIFGDPSISVIFE